MLFATAVIVAFPSFLPSITPALFTVATLGLLLFHVTSLFGVVVAFTCFTSPTWTDVDLVFTDTVPNTISCAICCNSAASVFVNSP